MITKINPFLNSILNLNIGHRFFLLGIFFLPSIFALGSLLLLIGLFYSLANFKALLKDKWNYPIFFSMGLMIFGSFNINFINNPFKASEFNTSIIWLMLLKWIILLVCFCGFQIYIDTNNKRKLFAKFFLAGTIPVIISCFLQKFFLYNDGPYQILNGLVIWYQKNKSISGGISGLFSNVNYTGIWLGLSLPFCICFARSENDRKSKWFLITLILFISFFIFETNSRNAYLSFLIAFIFMLRFKDSIKFILTNFFITLIFRIANLDQINLFFNTSLTKIIGKTSVFNISLDNARGSIYKEAISLIGDRPFFGWGASTFNFMFTQNNLNRADLLVQNPYHAHNMPLELAYNFGIPLSILIMTFTITLIFVSTIKIINNKFNKEEYLINKAVITSALIVFATHIYDVSFYEDRIALLICIFFSQLVCIIKDKNFSYFKEKI